MIKSQNIAVIGLGSMGYGIALSCFRGGHQTYGYDVNEAQAERFLEDGGSKGELNEIAGTLDAVIVVVLNAAQTESVLFGDDGVVPRLKSGALVISCATVAPEFAKDMEARCNASKISYLDAPISGGSVKAAAGALSIMASGRPEAFEKAAPVLDAISETVFKLGDRAGPGSAMKAVNQLLAGVHIATMAEAMTFGMTQGVDPKQFLDVISKCAGSSWMLENRAPHIVDGDYTPHSQMNIWPKDLGIVLKIANGIDFPAPIASAALGRYLEAMKMGLGNEDDAAIAKVYAKDAGLTLPGEAK